MKNMMDINIDLLQLIFDFWIEELHKPLIKKSNKKRIFPFCREYLGGTDLADMQLISKFNE